jgi:hypothetical protein
MPIYFLVGLKNKCNWYNTYKHKKSATEAALLNEL